MLNFRTRSPYIKKGYNRLWAPVRKSLNLSVQSSPVQMSYSYRDFAGKLRHVIMLNLFIGWFSLGAKNKLRQRNLAQQSSINLSCCKHPFLLHFFSF